VYEFWTTARIDIHFPETISLLFYIGMRVMIKLFFIFTVSIYLLPNTLYCQNSSPDSSSNTIGLKLRPALLLPESNPTIELHFSQDSSRKQYHFRWMTPPPINNPFKLDTRSSSYYVPRDVRDELNLIMNRPRESAFMPVLGVAYLAYQLAQKYLFVRSKTEISSHDLIAAGPNLDILRSLWKKSPQSLTEIYEDLHGLNPTILRLENKLKTLQDSKLIRPRQTESQTVYFPAVTKEVLRTKVTAALMDSTLDDTEIEILQNLLPDLNK
jgi:predicted transcriptional regulator